MILHEGLAEYDPCHGEGVLGAFRCGHRTHEGFIGITQVGVYHIEMALVDRDVDRLADGAALVLQPGGHVGQLDKVLEIPDGAVAPSSLPGR